ncbi:MAG: 50S ribosomal protein L19 [Elusimicrobia bacterium]|jgi:large subunit ribosomal protein L19|nr:50S ribosomal protein L19 [Elusimicrobiota bacterium]
MKKIMTEMINKHIRKDLPEFNPGDNLKVEFKVGEEKKRIQVFEGLVIAKSGEGLNKTFTLRKHSFGIGVEKVFPYHSPLIKSIKVVRKGKVRRSKLYYMRQRYGKAARIKEKTDY